MGQSKKCLLINQKLAILFLVIGSLILMGIVAVYASHRNINNQRQEVEQVRTINVKLLQLKNTLINASNGHPELKKKIVSDVHDFRNDFESFYAHNVGIPFDTLSDSLKNKVFSKKKESIKILFSTRLHYNKLEKNFDYLLFHDLFTDSIYHVVDESLIFNESTVSKQQLIKEKRLRVLKNTTKQKLANMELMIGQIEKDLGQLQSIYNNELNSSQNIFRFLIVLVSILLLGYIIFAYSYARRLVITPLKNISETTSFILQGDLQHKIPYQENNEIGILSRAINTLASDIVNATSFINEIKSGQLEDNATLSSPKFRKNPLSQALLDLRDELRTLAQHEQQRSWSVEGQTVFAEILSRQNKNLELLADEIIIKMVRYIDARQGMLFVHENTASPTEYGGDEMFLASCYAFDRRKYINKTIQKSEGLTGQVWQEEKTLYLENIPENHTEIKSGLGNASPVSLLIVPLIEGHKIYGILELALFKPLEQYKIEFVEKIAENIASTLAGVENSNRTQRLLEESQQLTEKMRAQEEEMLQNLEELQETQEEIKRRELQKDLELKVFTEKYDREVTRHKQETEKYKEQVKTLTEQLVVAETDNRAIRELKEINQELQDKITDLEETVKIKEMKVSKMRKKLSGDD